TTGGAIIYDNGQFLYSHHATDPCSGRLVNAFDLVRLHKFGDQDDAAVQGTPTNRLPSYVAMTQFALQDAGVAAVMAQERYERAVEAFSEPLPTDSTASQQTQPNTQPTDYEWLKKLEIAPTTGKPAKTPYNILTLLKHDPHIAGRIYRDTFTD